MNRPSPRPWLYAFILLCLASATSAMGAGPSEPNVAPSEPRIAVVEFDNLTEQARKHGRGRMIAEFFTTAAAKTSGLRVVERERIRAVLDELEFGESGKTYGSMAQKVGDMAGADFVLTGSVSEQGDAARIDARVVETKNGKVLAAESVETKSGVSALSQAVGKVMGKLSASLRPPAESPLKVRLWTDKKHYVAGDRVRIYIQGNRDFYGRVAMIGADGAIMQLLPNAYRTANFFAGNKTYALPSEGDAYTLDVVPPFGRDRIVLYARLTPLGDAPLAPLDKGLGQFKGDEETLTVLTRAIKVAPKTPGAPAAAGLSHVGDAGERTDLLKVETVIETR